MLQQPIRFGKMCANFKRRSWYAMVKKQCENDAKANGVPYTKGLLWYSVFCLLYVVDVHDNVIIQYISTPNNITRCTCTYQGRLPPSSRGVF